MRDGTLKGVLRVLAQDLRERGGLDVREAFIDGTFSGAKKGGFALANQHAHILPVFRQVTSGERGSKSFRLPV